MTDSSTSQAEQNQSEKQKKSQQAITSTLMFSQHFRVTLMVALISITMIALFSGSGYLLDIQLDTEPLFLLIGVVISFPLSQLAVYRWVKKSYVPKITSQDKKS